MKESTVNNEAYALLQQRQTPSVHQLEKQLWQQSFTDLHNAAPYTRRLSTMFYLLFSCFSCQMWQGESACFYVCMHVCLCVCVCAALSLLTSTQLSWEPISHHWAQLWRPRSCSRFICTRFLLSAPNEGVRMRGREKGRRRSRCIILGEIRGMCAGSSPKLDL